MDPNDVFGQMRLFAALSPRELLLVRQEADLVSLVKDEVVFREGDAGDALYGIISGSVRVARQGAADEEEVLAMLEAGGCFGELSLVDLETRSATVIANEPTELIRIRRKTFNRLVEEDHELALKLYRALVRILCERLRATNDSLTFSRTMLQGLMDKGA
jgi:CRP-like cAMP-binding protein